MQLKPYVEAIMGSKEDKQKALAPAHAAQTEAQLGLAITELELEIGEINLEVQSNASGYPLDIDELRYSLDRKELADRRLEQLKEIRAQLFPKK